MGSGRPRAGKAGVGCLWTGRSWPAAIYACAFCFPHAISENPADEEEQWSDEFVSICSWDQEVLFPLGVCGKPFQGLVSELHAGGQLHITAGGWPGWEGHLQTK